MTPVFMRILEKKKQSGLTWDEIAKAAHISLGSWMTGLPTNGPSDVELIKLAPVLNTSIEWLKYGQEEAKE